MYTTTGQIYLIKKLKMFREDIARELCRGELVERIEDCDEQIKDLSDRVQVYIIQKEFLTEELKSRRYDENI